MNKAFDIFWSVVVFLLIAVAAVAVVVANFWVFVVLAAACLLGLTIIAVGLAISFATAWVATAVQKVRTWWRS